MEILNHHSIILLVFDSKVLKNFGLNKNKAS
jgi:hypothetical protein